MHSKGKVHKLPSLFRCVRMVSVEPCVSEQTYCQTVIIGLVGVCVCCVHGCLVHVLARGQLSLFSTYSLRHGSLTESESFPFV